MNYWLLKTEPETYSWDNLVHDKKTVWDGVKNFQARKNLKAMKKGDCVYVYHTGTEKAIVGMAKVVKEAYPDPNDKEWVVIEISADKKLKRSVTLAEVKAEKKLKDMALAKYARLSVQPVKKEEADYVNTLSGTK